MATEKEISQIKELPGLVFAVAMSPDGQTLACGCIVWGEKTKWDGTTGEVKLFKIKSEAEIATLKGHAKLVRSLAFSPNGKNSRIGK